MTWPVDQSILADPVRGDGHDSVGMAGDCFRAALATLLGQELYQVPHFVGYLSWFRMAREHVRSTWPGWDLGYYDAPEEWPIYRALGARWQLHAFPPLVIADGPSPRGNFLHAIVLDSATGEMFHDPHPSRAGVTQVEGVFALVSEAAAGPLPAQLELTAGAAA